MSTPITKTTELPEVSEQPAVPICLACCDPVEPLDTVCPHCGAAVGQLTPFLPYESIRWSSDIWGRMWHQIWKPGCSFISRGFRFLMVIVFAPVLLIGLLVRKK